MNEEIIIYLKVYSEYSHLEDWPTRRSVLEYIKKENFYRYSNERKGFILPRALCSTILNMLNNIMVYEYGERKHALINRLTEIAIEEITIPYT